MSHNLRTRKPTRKPDLDYTRLGFYFVTICTKEKEEILGKVIGENIALNDYGRIVWECWLALPDHYSCCRLHEFVIMPNHVHGIIEITVGFNVGAGLRPARSSPHPASLSEIIRAFKAFSARTINQKYPDGLFQWQRSFHDRVIRDKGELAAISRYIAENPRHWSNDEENLNVGAGLPLAGAGRPAR
jgi:REP element-mobilizing transposase RayT